MWFLMFEERNIKFVLSQKLVLPWEICEKTGLTKQRRGKWTNSAPIPARLRREKFWICHACSYPPNIRLDKDILKTSWKRCPSLSSEDVLKRSVRIYSTWSRIFTTSWHLAKFALVNTSWRPLQNVFKTFSRCLQNVSLIGNWSCQLVFNTFSRRTMKISTERFALATLPEEFMVRL